MRKQYRNPPIKEAIFTFHFNDNIDKGTLLDFRNSSFVSRKFKLNESIYSISISNPKKPQDKEPMVTSHNEEGFILRRNEESNNLVRILSTHLSYHKFNKYAGWEEMCADLKIIWSEFCEGVNNPSLSKISVRYINQLSLPLDEDLADYVKLSPSVPEGINYNNNFFLQINVASKDEELKGVITETMLPNNKIERRNMFLIDINVSNVRFFECKDKSIWIELNKLREFKNDLFFGCITEKTTEIFN